MIRNALRIFAFILFGCSFSIAQVPDQTKVISGAERAIEHFSSRLAQHSQVRKGGTPGASSAIGA